MLFKDAIDNLAYRFGKSADEPFKERLRRDINVARAEILRREVNKRTSIPYMHTHTLFELKVIEETEQNPFPSKTVYRTEEKIPKPIMYHDQEPGFIYVGGSDSDSPFHFIRPERLTYRTTAFKSSQVYTYVNEYLYFPDNVSNINSRALFSDLIRLAEIKNKDDKICIPTITITDDLFTGIKRFLLEEENELSIRYKTETEVNVDSN